MDTRNGQEQFDLRQEFFSDDPYLGFEIFLAEFKTFHVRADNAELFSLLGAHDSVRGGLNFFGRSFELFGEIRLDVKGFWTFEQAFRDGGSGFAEDVRKNVVQLDVGNGEAILGAVFFAGCVACQLKAIAHQISKLANVRRRDKASDDKVVLENVGNPLGVPLVVFLALDCLDVFWVRENNIAGKFKNVEHGNPILS